MLNKFNRHKEIFAWVERQVQGLEEISRTFDEELFRDKVYLQADD